MRGILKEYFILILSCSFIFLLISCGGGNGDGDGTSPPLRPPSNPLDKWHLRLDSIPLPYASAYGNGLFVNPFSTSTDGINWTIRTSEISKYNIHIAYGNDIFVAVGEQGFVATSTDGINWTKRDAGISDTLNKVVFINGTFVAFSSVGTTLFPKSIIMSSTDGLNWTFFEVDYHISSIAHGNSIYVAVGENGVILTSPDLSSWTLRNSGISNNLISVAYGNGIFVAIGIHDIVTSQDGINWTSRISGSSSGELREIVYGNSIFVVISRGSFYAHGGKILISSDGINWTISDFDYYPNGIFYGNDMFVVYGVSGGAISIGAHQVSTSVDGISWTKRNISELSFPQSKIRYGNNTFVVTGSSILVSPDGVTWTIVSLPYENKPYDIDFGKGIFVGLKDTNILTSEDGMNWTIRYSGIAYLTRVVYCNDVFFALGDQGTIVTSPDGINWTIRNSDSRYILNGVVFGNNTFVAVGTSGALLTSNDGELWTLRDTGTGDNLYAVFFINSNFIAFGSSQTINSYDGISWNVGNLGLPEYVEEIAYGKGYYIATGKFVSNVFVSTDGINWTVKDLVFEGPTFHFHSVVFANNIFTVLNSTGGSDFSDIGIYQSNPL